MSEKIYLKNNLIFSNSITEISIYENFDNIHFNTDSKNIIKSNKDIIIQFENFKKNSVKIIKINGLVNNYDELKLKIEKLPKSQLIKVKHDDYEFIEKTSQIEIIEQILNSVSEDNNINLKNDLDLYIKENTELEKNKITEINSLIKEENLKIKQLETKIKHLEETRLSLFKKKELNLKKELDNLHSKKLKLEEELENNSLKEQKEEELEILNQRSKKISFEIEENKIDIKILKAKLSNVIDSIKLGNTKTINPISFLLTLGFIYWTKYSNLKYVKNKLHLKINKKHEEELYLEKKLHKIKCEISEKKIEIKKLLIKISKKETLISKEIDLLELDIKDQENLNKEFRKKLEIEINQLKDIEKEKSTFISKKKELELIKQEYENNSLRKIKDLFNEIKKTKTENLNKLKELKTQLKSQKTKIKGEYIVNL